MICLQNNKLLTFNVFDSISIYYFIYLKDRNQSNNTPNLINPPLDTKINHRTKHIDTTRSRTFPTRTTPRRVFGVRIFHLQEKLRRFISHDRRFLNEISSFFLRFGFQSTKRARAGDLCVLLSEINCRAATDCNYCVNTHHFQLSAIIYCFAEFPFVFLHVAEYRYNADCVNTSQSVEEFVKSFAGFRGVKLRLFCWLDVWFVLFSKSVGMKIGGCIDDFFVWNTMCSFK